MDKDSSDVIGNIGIEVDIRLPAHCMMRRDDVCPDLKGGSK